MTLVSVIVPFHNRIEWLAEAVLSVLDQSYRNIDIVLVDDGSTENTDRIANIKDRRLRYYRQGNKGASIARNYGIDVAKGSYIAFLDSDDLFAKSKIEKQLAYMEENPDVLLSHTSYETITERGDFLQKVPSGEFSGDVYPQIICGCPIATPTVMVCRKVFDEGLRFEESVNVGEDIILWARIAKRSNILGIDEYLTKVRIHKNSASIDPGKQLRGNLNVIRRVSRYDRNIGVVLKLRTMSLAYLRAAYLYYTRGRILAGLAAGLVGLAVFPPSILKHIRIVSGILVPGKLKRSAGKRHRSI